MRSIRPPGLSSAASSADLHLRLGAGDFDLLDVVRGAARVQSSVTVDEFGHVGRAGAGADAEQAAIGERPVEGVDRVGEAAGLADLVPKPRGQAAAEHVGKQMGGVVAGSLKEQPGKPEHEVGLFEPAGDAPLAARIAAAFGAVRSDGAAWRRSDARRRLDDARRAPRRRRRRAPSAGRVFAGHEGADRAAVEGVDRCRACPRIGRPIAWPAKAVSMKAS